MDIRIGENNLLMLLPESPSTFLAHWPVAIGYSGYITHAGRDLGKPLITNTGVIQACIGCGLPSAARTSAVLSSLIPHRRLFASCYETACLGIVFW